MFSGPVKKSMPQCPPTGLIGNFWGTGFEDLQIAFKHEMEEKATRRPLVDGAPFGTPSFHLCLKEKEQRKNRTPNLMADRSWFSLLEISWVDEVILFHPWKWRQPLNKPLVFAMSLACYPSVKQAVATKQLAVSSAPKNYLQQYHASAKSICLESWCDKSHLGFICPI